MKALVALALLLPALACGDVIAFSIKPSSADPDIKAFDDPHVIYVNRDIIVDHKTDVPQDRHELLLFLTGTGGKANSARIFLELAANLGYHVISLMYPDDIAASTCASDRDPDGFERFRMAILEGGDSLIKGGRSSFSVDRQDSIVRRLDLLLVKLQKMRPREKWGQFLNEDGTLKWPSIAVAGQSQGGGHAALIGIKCPVARVLCFGAPKDFSTRYQSSARWLGETSATPKNRFFAFNHVQDCMACTPEQQMQNLRTLGLLAFGEPVQVDSEQAPYHHTRVLSTAYPPEVNAVGTSDGSRLAHTSVIAGIYADRRLPVWTYMLTEPISNAQDSSRSKR